ncbi:alpha-1,2-mannosyltransferase [Paraburkholderia sp. GAS448]|uniref:glycosyltransferase family 87 protein n=1 Tax=Paraburkholderia sp. GAS448 TaxID=3035136 RepID=UPI003D251AA9
MPSNTTVDGARPLRKNAADENLVGRYQLYFFLLVFVVSPMVDLVTRWIVSPFPSLTHLLRVGMSAWVTGLPAAEDSWESMRAALDWFLQNPGGRMYQQLFFVEGIKFQDPPSSLLPLYTLSLFGIHPGNAALNRFDCLLILLNVLASGAFAFTLALRSPGCTSRRWPIAAAAACGTLLFFPLLAALTIGQVQSWINALFAFAALAWLLRRKGLSGLLIGLICLIKPLFMLFFVWGLLRREWRFVAGWSVMVLAGLAASLSVFGVQNHLDYLSVLHAVSRTGEVYRPNQSINGVLNALYRTGDPNVWQARGFPSFDPFVYAGTVASSAALIAAALLIPLFSRPRLGLLDFAGAALTFTLASPIAWEHDYSILPTVYIAAMFALLIRKATPMRTLGFATLAISYLLTAHWLGGYWMLAGVLALLTLIHALNFGARGDALGASN